MRNHLFSIISLPLLLAACDSMSGTQESADEMMDRLNVPKIQGVDKTMLRMADEAERQGNFVKAAQTYQQILDKNQGNEAYAIRYAENLRKAGEPAKALNVFHSIVTRNPNNVDALEGKGLTLLALADIDAASKTLGDVARLAPNRWRTLNAIGVLFATKALYFEAQQYFVEALKFKPNHSAILNNQGLVYALDLQHARSLDTLFKASKHATLPMQQAQTDLNAALVFAIAGDLKKAETMAVRHLSGAALQNNLGLYALLNQDAELAKTHLHMALSENKVFYEKAWNNLEILKSPGGASSTQAKRMTIGGSEVEDTSPNLPSPPKKTYSISSQQPAAAAPNVAPQQYQQQAPASGGSYTPTAPSGAFSNDAPAAPAAGGQPNGSASSGFEAVGDFLTNW